MDILEKGKDDILRLYTEISHIAPSADLRRKNDAREAETCDITKIISENSHGAMMETPMLNMKDVVCVSCWIVSMQSPFTVPPLHRLASFIIPHLHASH